MWGRDRISKINDFGLDDLLYRFRDDPYEVPFYHLNYEESPYEVWHHCDDTVAVHRLVAIAEYGFDAVVDKVIHHRNEIPWANWHSNLVPMTHKEHMRHHAETSDKTPPEGF